MGTTECKTLDDLNKALKEIFLDPNSPYKQVIVQANPGLHYGELMSVVNVCASQKKADGSKLTEDSASWNSPDEAD